MCVKVVRKIGSIVSITKGKKHEVAEIPSTNAKRVIGIDDLRNDDLIRYTNDLIGIEITPNDLLIAWDGANAGTIGFGKAGYAGSTIARLRLNTDAGFSTPFLGLFLKSKFDYLRQTATGATIPHINRSALESIIVPEIELGDQKRIAHLLGKVEGLIALRKQHLQQLDELLKSVFLEMFGDPVRNENIWSVKNISDVCDEIVDCVNKTAPQVEERTPYLMIRTSNIRNGKISLVNVKYVSEGVFKIWTRRSKPVKGDILFTREAPMGEVGIIDFDDQVFLGQRIMQYRCNTHEIVPRFLLSLMKTSFFQRQIDKLGKGSTVKHLAVPDCFKFKVIVPPILEQEKFAAIVEKIESLKSRYQQSLTDLENLYGALSQQAFKGELDLSRVPLNTDSAVTPKTPKPFSQGFARQLLAAEILHRHHQHNMTQMKLQKLIHLTEYHAQLDEIQGNYQRQAAGPYDNRIMYGVSNGLEKQQWFKTVGRWQNATYSPLAKAGGHKKYLSHWQDRIQKIDELLNLLGKATPEQCEIVSTLYAAWNDLLIDNEQINDERIIAEASSPERWHQEKAKIEPDKWPVALQWMRDNNLIPTGYGTHTRKLQ